MAYSHPNNRDTASAQSAVQNHQSHQSPQIPSTCESRKADLSRSNPRGQVAEESLDNRQEILKCPHVRNTVSLGHHPRHRPRPVLRSSLRILRMRLSRPDASAADSHPTLFRPLFWRVAVNVFRRLAIGTTLFWHHILRNFRLATSTAVPQFVQCNRNSGSTRFIRSFQFSATNSDIVIGQRAKRPS